MSGALVRRLSQTVDDGASAVSDAPAEDLVLSDAWDARPGELVACDVMRDVSCFCELVCLCDVLHGCCVRCFLKLFC